MGIDSAGVIFLSGAKWRGADFSKTVTIGRQAFFPEPDGLARAFAASGISLDPQTFIPENPFSERFFTLLGAKEIVSIDYSSYERPTLTHDFNKPIPAEWREMGSVVFDGGTIEHVFNVPQAFKNCMELVKIGGYFLQLNVANNYLGHGFWQFSPELLFRIFTPENGFQTEAVLLHEIEFTDVWYRVSDPAEVGWRVELHNCRPTYILTIAKRIATTEIFANPPLQSDYVSLWSGRGKKSSAAGAVPQRVKSFVPGSLRRLLKPLLMDWSLMGLGWDKPYFMRLSADAVANGRFS